MFIIKSSRNDINWKIYKIDAHSKLTFYRFIQWLQSRNIYKKVIQGFTNQLICSQKFSINSQGFALCKKKLMFLD